MSGTPPIEDQWIYTKSDAGREEMRTRASRLPSASRAILVMIDGLRSTQQLRELVAAAKAPADTLDHLLQLGLIRRREDGPASSPPASIPVAVAAPVAIASAEPANPPNPVTTAAPATPAPVTQDEAARHNALYTLLTEIVHDHLGMRGYFMQLKIERCGNVADMLDLANGDLRAALIKSVGEPGAATLLGRIARAAGR